MGEQVDARTAAARLGVDVRTLYAYVSRGALRRVPGPDGRSSRYDSDELDLLARRSRPRTLPRPPASIDVVIATRVSTVTDGRIWYRRTDLLDLVADHEPFETVAELLWGAPSAAGRHQRPRLPGPPGPPAGAERPGPEKWRLPDDCAAAAALVLSALGDEVPVLGRYAAVVAGLAPPEPAEPADLTRRTGLDGLAHLAGLAYPSGHGGDGKTGGPDWPAWGRRLICALVQASGPAPGARAASTAARAAEAGGVAGELWQRWSPLRPTAARVRALNMALVLLAEHELASSTLAVRVAASARAGPAGCMLAGLGTLSGALHGDVARLVQERLAGGHPAPGDDIRHPPGFGHPVHRHGDPRAAPLLRAVAAIATPADRELVERAVRAAPAPPNSDFALAALCHVARMPPPAATAIFAVARTAGWMAHAAEEYAEPSVRFRGRAVGRAEPARPGRR